MSSAVGVPGVVINDLAFRLDKGVIDDLQGGTDHSHSGQLQALSRITLRRMRSKMN